MKRIPEIRLKGFEGEWEETILGDVVQDCSYGVGAEAIPYDGKHKYIRITDIDDDSRNFVPNPLVSPSYYTPYYKVKENDLLFARTGASVGKTYLYHKDDGDLYYAGYLIKMNVMKADSEFVFLQTLLQKYKDWIVSESQRSGQPGINLQQLSNYFFNAPDIKEQQSIASFFLSFDSLIFEHQQRLENLRRVKKSMLQKMFPQQGQTVPEIRFKGFEGEWKRKRLGDVLEVGNGCDYKHLNEGNVPVYGTGGIITFVDDYLYDGETVCIGRKGTIDLPIYHKGKIWTVDTLFYTYNIDCNVRFLYYLFCTIDWKMYNEATGVPSLSKENIKKIASCFPENDEQCQIASFFTSLDNLITQEVKYIDQLNRVKHTLLQKMFV